LKKIKRASVNIFDWLDQKNPLLRTTQDYNDDKDYIILDNMIITNNI